VSLNEILQSALSGLGASQAGMRTVSNNIANVGTPGYARERVALSAQVTSGRVTGVVVGEPSRVADRYLEETVYSRAGDAGRANVTSDYLDRLQSLLGTTGAESALPARIDAIGAAATAMTGSSATAQTAAAFVGQVDDALNSLRQLSGDIAQMRSDADGEVSAGVDRINVLLRTVGDLNDTIASLSGLGRSTAGAADQRAAALQELSGLIGITAREQSNGRVSVDTATGVPLIDQRIRQIGYPSSGAGTSQSIYPAIAVHFVNADGSVGAATGETLDTPAVGGKLGGLLDLRDSQLPAFADKLGALFGGLQRTLNAASNASTAMPPPSTSTGRTTAMAGADRLGFTGATTISVVGSDGKLARSVTIDFAAAGAPTTIDGLVSAIDAGLGAGTATFANGKLTLASGSAAQGIAIGGNATRAGTGLSQFFGLNDLIRSDDGSLAPAGFVGTDPHRFTGGTVELALRDASGRLMGKGVLTPAAGGTFADLVAGLNAGNLGAYGSFALGSDGRVAFAPSAGNTGASLSVLSDTTARANTGRSFTDLAGLTGDSAGLTDAALRRDIRTDPTRLPLAQVQAGAVGATVLGGADRRGATGYVEALSTTTDLGRAGAATISRFAATVLGDAGSAAARAATRTDEARARRDDAITRRDSFSGVNIDEELGQMVILQNSYSAAARVMSTANQMFETLVGMMG